MRYFLISKCSSKLIMVLGKAQITSGVSLFWQIFVCGDTLSSAFKCPGEKLGNKFAFITTSENHLSPLYNFREKRNLRTDNIPFLHWF